MKKNVTILILTLCLTILSAVFFSTYAAEITDSGECGEMLTWTLDNEGTLTISGTGDMTSYALHSDTPWYEERELIKKLAIDDNVTSVGDYAFYNCLNITDLTLSKNLKSIGYSAFDGCSGLSSLKIPDSVTNLGMRCFSGCTGITELTLSESLTSIPQDAFFNCKSLLSLSFPDSITSIGKRAFNNCHMLSSLTFTDNIISIGEDAFNGCQRLRELTLPRYLEAIETSAFFDCRSLREITIPVSVTSIGFATFSNSHSLKNIYYLGTEEQWNDISINANAMLTENNPKIHYLGNTSGETMLDENFKEVPIPEDALVVAIFRKNATGDKILKEAYGINFNGTNYLGAVEVPMDGIWVIKLVDPYRDILTIGQKYTYSVFTNGETIAENLTYTVK